MKTSHKEKNCRPTRMGSKYRSAVAGAELRGVSREKKKGFVAKGRESPQEKGEVGSHGWGQNYREGSGANRSRGIGGLKQGSTARKKREKNLESQQE